LSAGTVPVRRAMVISIGKRERQDGDRNSLRKKTT
jgi:hypothetical protein